MGELPTLRTAVAVKDSGCVSEPLLLGGRAPRSAFHRTGVQRGRSSLRIPSWPTSMYARALRTPKAIRRTEIRASSSSGLGCLRHADRPLGHWLDIVVHAEEVGGIVLGFEFQ